MASDGVLSKTLVEQMLTKHKNEWGLGPSLLWDSDSLIFQHGGKNAGFTNNMISFVHKGNAVIIMTNGDNGWEVIEEILRSVSSYYHWGISNPRIVETVELSNEVLNQFTGRYKLELHSQQGDDYLIEILLRNNQVQARNIFKNKKMDKNMKNKKKGKLGSIILLYFIIL